MGRRITKEYLCEVHRDKGMYAGLYCHACFRANLEAPNRAKLKALFPVIMAED